MVIDKDCLILSMELLPNERTKIRSKSENTSNVVKKRVYVLYTWRKCKMKLQLQALSFPFFLTFTLLSNNLQGVIGSKSLLRTVEKSPCKLIIYSAKSVYEFIQKVITKTLMILALLTWKMKSKNHQQQIWIYMISIHSKLNSWIPNHGGSIEIER